MKGTEKIFNRIRDEKFLNLEKEIDTHFQKTQRIPNMMYPSISTPKYKIIEISKVKDKERILKAASEMQKVMYKGNPIRVSANFSTETCKPGKSGMIHSNR